MPTVIQAHDNHNQPLVDANHELLKLTYFNLVRLEPGQAHTEHVPGFELAAVVLGGRAGIRVGGHDFGMIGERADVWSGLADSVYAGTGAPVTLTAADEPVEIAIAGARCDEPREPFRVTPAEVDLVDVGSPETHSRRRIYHILGNQHHDRVGRLLISELYADEGCWNGYPPHKHDTDTGEEETNHEEVYHFRYRPANGFGAQFAFQPDGTREVFMMCDGDTFLLDRGYHPTVTSPGHEEYIFTILVGASRRSLVQNFKEDYRYIMDRIPGIGAMRDKFK